MSYLTNQILVHEGAGVNGGGAESTKESNVTITNSIPSRSGPGLELKRLGGMEGQLRSSLPGAAGIEALKHMLIARRFAHELPGVAASIREGTDEILTVNRLGLPAELRRSLAPTASRTRWERCAASVAV